MAQWCGLGASSDGITQVTGRSMAVMEKGLVIPRSGQPISTLLTWAIVVTLTQHVTSVNVTSSQADKWPACATWLSNSVHVTLALSWFKREGRPLTSLSIGHSIGLPHQNGLIVSWKIQLLLFIQPHCIIYNITAIYLYPALHRDWLSDELD